DEPCGRGALPQELVHPTRRSVAQQHAGASDRDARRRGQRREPRAMLAMRVRERVVVGELREVVVARVGVAARTVLAAVADRVVVVALDRADRERPQQLYRAIGVRPEATSVAEEEDGLGAARLRIANGGG